MPPVFGGTVAGTVIVGTVMFDDHTLSAVADEELVVKLPAQPAP